MLRKVFSLPIELYQNRKLILTLAKNDFKTKYAGSFFGIVWAFIQPIVTVLVYWFVFQIGLRSQNVGDIPFVLWLIAGLVPWFFFSEALGSGTNALMEYGYLVKKIVFKISILPIVKVMSALFVHFFFLLFAVLLYTGYGRFPGIYLIQVLYYSFCAFMFVLAITYTTCSVVIFFRDLSQIINIVLQVGVWMTPIMWHMGNMMNSVAQTNPELARTLEFIFKLNPMYYIVMGYRDSFIDKVWFFDHMKMTLYFWGVTAFIFIVGTVIFKRLKVHFADIM